MSHQVCAWTIVCWLMGWLSPGYLLAEAPRLSIATFAVDATPPLGSPLCDGAVPPAQSIVDPLSARGIVLLGTEPPIVLCAVDWVGIGNGGYDAWRQALTKAAGTTPDRVSVHTLHQHDAPGCDFEVEEILAARGLSGTMFHVAFARQTITSAATALSESMKHPIAVTHLGLGVAKVEKVASTRRVLGPDGKVKFVRYSANNSDEVRAEPEGSIDPDVRLIGFWAGERPLAALTYYATHPQSYYGKGGVSCDFPGIARAIREQAQPGVAMIHFDGAGGDVTAGKYNDGKPGTRRVLAERLAASMEAAWNSARKVPVTAGDVQWSTSDVALPLNPDLESEAAILSNLDNQQLRLSRRIGSACNLVWIRRSRVGHKISLSRLRLGPAYVLHMPGELLVEYQLAAQRLRPNDFVAMAAYGDYGPGYVGTEISYTQGGYEPTGSRVAPAVEGVLMTAIKKLLE